jgi:O-antigen/teichoic acid export membrane protein
MLELVQMRTGQTSFITFVSNFVSSGAGFVGTIVFARLLGADILGQYYFLLSIVAWLALAATLGFDSAVTKRLSEGVDRGAYKVAGGLCIVALTATIVLLLTLGEDIVRQLFGVQRISFLILLLIVGVVGSYVDAILQGVHLVHVYAGLRPVRRIIRTLVQVGGILLSFGLVALVYGYATGGVVIILIGLYIVGGPFHLPTRKHFQSLFDYARFAWLGRIEGKTFDQADILILGVFVSNSFVGVYGITWSLANFLIIFSNAISSSLFPELSKLSADESLVRVASLLEDSLAYAGLFTIPGIVGGALLSERLLRVYGPEFADGSKVLWLLIGAVLIYGYQRQIVNVLSAIDRPDESFKINSVLILSNLVLNFFLIREYGIFGAASATILSVLLSFIVGYVMLSRHVDITVPIDRIGTQIAAALGMGLIVVAVEILAKPVFSHINNTVTTATLVILGAAVYFTFLWGLSSDFRRIVRENIPVF